VYPNPAKNIVNLKISGTTQECSVEVMDNLGKVVQDLTMTGMSNTTIDFSAYAQGTYFIKFVDSKNGLNKVIKVQKVD
jgi:hypothetical protein